MSETFYRYHWADCPAFSVENAWSALWGAERSEDGSQTRCNCGDFADYERECPACRGIGEGCNGCDGSGYIVSCPHCGGTGWMPCVPGYSCERVPETLAEYIREHTGGTPADGKVIVFEGEQVGAGFDGEPTAVPIRILETFTWDEFLARHVGVPA